MPPADVVIPARNEERTVAQIVGPLVQRDHRVIVVDSASSDGTARAASGAGAHVVAVDRPGKGRALRRGVEEAESEMVVFCDADLTAFDPAWVEQLCAPLADPSVHLVKPIYGRPLRLPELGLAADEGGRVTELLARPLLAALVPELAHLAQPLAGEYAARRDVVMECGFPDGYGVEIALVLQVADLYGAGAVAEVDLHADRWHRNRPLHELSATAAEVVRTALTVLENQGRIKLAEPLGVELTRPNPAGSAAKPTPRA